MAHPPLPDNIRARAREARRWGLGALFLTPLGFVTILGGYTLQTTNVALALLAIFGGVVMLAVGQLGFMEWLTLRAPVTAFKRSPKNRKKVEKLIAAGLPYGFYLRDFRPEARAVFKSVPINGSFPDYQDHVEHSLVRELSDSLPFFALLNVEDADMSPVAARVYCDSESWFEMFTHYASNSALVIMNVDTLTANVRRELDWAIQPDRKCRVLIVCTNSGLDQVRDAYPEVDERCWVVLRAGRKTQRPHPLSWERDTHGPTSVSVPHEVRKFVQDLSRPKVEQIQLQSGYDGTERLRSVDIDITCKFENERVEVVMQPVGEESNWLERIPQGMTILFGESKGMHTLNYLSEFHPNCSPETIRKLLRRVKIRTVRIESNKDNKPTATFLCDLPESEQLDSWLVEHEGRSTCGDTNGGETPAFSVRNAQVVMRMAFTIADADSDTSQ